MSGLAVMVRLLTPTARVPRYMTAGAAGADLFADCIETVIHQGEWKLIPTGISLEIPTGYEGQIRPRSGLALKQGLTVLNAPGTIDSDYRGAVGVVLINHGDRWVEIKGGDRIAQIVIAPVARARFEVVAALDETARGVGGFGHTDNGGEM